MTARSLLTIVGGLAVAAGFLGTAGFALARHIVFDHTRRRFIVIRRDPVAFTARQVIFLAVGIACASAAGLAACSGQGN